MKSDEKKAFLQAQINVLTYGRTLLGTEPKTNILQQLIEQYRKEFKEEPRKLIMDINGVSPRTEILYEKFKDEAEDFLNLKNKTEAI